MRFHVIEQQTSNGAQCPVRVVEQKTGREVGWINRYLDREYVRRLAVPAESPTLGFTHLQFEALLTAAASPRRGSP